MTDFSIRGMNGGGPLRPSIVTEVTRFADNGMLFAWDASGTLANRDQFITALPEFAFLALDDTPIRLYIKKSRPGVVPIVWQPGPAAPDITIAEVAEAEAAAYGHAQTAQAARNDATQSANSASTAAGVASTAAATAAQKSDTAVQSASDAIAARNTAQAASVTAIQGAATSTQNAQQTQSDAQTTAVNRSTAVQASIDAVAAQIVTLSNAAAVAASRVDVANNLAITQTLAADVRTYADLLNRAVYDFSFASEPSSDNDWSK